MEFLLHSAEAQALARPARWDIMNATLARSVKNPCGMNSKWIAQSIKNVRQSPGSPVYWVGGASLQEAPPECAGASGNAEAGGVGGAGLGRRTWPSRSCS